VKKNCLKLGNQSEAEAEVLDSTVDKLRRWMILNRDQYSRCMQAAKFSSTTWGREAWQKGALSFAEAASVAEEQCQELRGLRMRNGQAGGVSTAVEDPVVTEVTEQQVSQFEIPAEAVLAVKRGDASPGADMLIPERLVDGAWVMSGRALMLPENFQAARLDYEWHWDVMQQERLEVGLQGSLQWAQLEGTIDVMRQWQERNCDQQRRCNQAADFSSTVRGREAWQKGAAHFAELVGIATLQHRELCEVLERQVSRRQEQEAQVAAQKAISELQRNDSVPPVKRPLTAFENFCRELKKTDQSLLPCMTVEFMFSGPCTYEGVSLLTTGQRDSVSYDWRILRDTHGLVSATAVKGLSFDETQQVQKTAGVLTRDVGHQLFLTKTMVKLVVLEQVLNWQKGVQFLEAQLFELQNSLWRRQKNDLPTLVQC